MNSDRYLLKRGPSSSWGAGTGSYFEYGEKATMSGRGERQLVYTALSILCAGMALAAGPVAGILSLLQIGAVFELANWIGAPRGKSCNRRG